MFSSLSEEEKDELARKRDDDKTRKIIESGEAVVYGFIPENFQEELGVSQPTTDNKHKYIGED